LDTATLSGEYKFLSRFAPFSPLDVAHSFDLMRDLSRIGLGFPLFSTRASLRKMPAIFWSGLNGRKKIWWWRKRRLKMMGESRFFPLYSLMERASVELQHFRFSS